MRRVGSPELTWRRLRNLIGRLPRESELQVELHGPVPDRWTRTEYMLAALIDRITYLDWHFVSSRTKRRVPKPQPFPRPELTGADKGRGRLNPDQVRERLNAPRIAVDDQQPAELDEEVTDGRR